MPTRHYTEVPVGPETMDQRLRPFERLRCSFEFRQVFKLGRCYRSPFLRIHFRRSNRDFSRLGLVVRRKLGSADKRTRVKRCLREVFRTHKYLLNEPHDIVLVAQIEPQGFVTYREAFRNFLANYNRPRKRRGGSRSEAGTRMERRPAPSKG